MHLGNLGEELLHCNIKNWWHLIQAIYQVETKWYRMSNFEWREQSGSCYVVFPLGLMVSYIPTTYYVRSKYPLLAVPNILLY